MRAIYAIASSAVAALAIWHLAAGLTPAAVGHWPAALLGLALGAVAADAVAGTVHWACDTWGGPDTPWIGDNLIRWFREHHDDPVAIARKQALEIDGPACLAAAPALALLSLPGAQAALMPRPLLYACLWSLCCVGALANHLHAWAHAPRPPRLVRALQRAGLLLSKRAHARHHRLPRTEHYCIATGWLNRPLDALGVWRGLEAAVHTLTGARPRAGESPAQVRGPQPETP